MLKIGRIGLIISFSFALVFVGSAAFAKVQPSEIENAKSADQSGKSETTFKWDETPYLLMHFDHSGTVSESWMSPITKTLYQFTVADGQTTNPIDLDSKDKWVLNTLPDWLSSREKGIWTWSVEAVGGTKVQNGCLTVTPEPIGAALFMIGAGALGIIRNRRNKKKA